MIKKELQYFHINRCFGGNQNWFLDPWMHVGGCGALTMCDLMIYMALYRNLPEGYPYDINRLSKRDYRKFGTHMRPYLRPRQEGIKDLETFIDGAETYLKYSRINRVRLKPFDGNRSVEEAEAAIRKSIDDGLPVPMLMLKHQDPTFVFFEWHWFLIVGYAAPNADAESDLSSPDSGFQIKVATYGKAHWLDFESFWDTGFEERGGLVLVSQREGQRD